MPLNSVNKLRGRIERAWEAPGVLQWVLAPIGVLYSAITRLRRHAYQRKWLQSVFVDAPVIVVGNLTVGGTGKSPIVRALAVALLERGFKPGIILRGYGGRAVHSPRLVTKNSDPAEVGDEAVEHAMLLDGMTVVVGVSRVQAAQTAIKAGHCNVIIADDGLQHLNLGRILDVAVIDGQRAFGNGRCLPAGPLRESIAALENVDHIIINGASRPCIDLPVGVPCWLSRIVPGTIEAVDGSGRKAIVTALRNEPVMCMTAIGNPARFRKMITDLGLSISVSREFPDHYEFQPEDLTDHGQHQILMTLKDAVKCRRFLNERTDLATRTWYVNMTSQIDSGFVDAIIQKIDTLTGENR